MPIKTQNSDGDYFGHPPGQNRFGDPNLSAPFIWKKKYEKELPGVKGKKLKKIVEEKLKLRQKEIKSEIDSVRLLRQKRIADQAALEIMRNEAQILAERQNHALLDQAEERFHKKQAREGSLVRLREDRAARFDALFKVALFASAAEPKLEKLFQFGKQLKALAALKGDRALELRGKLLRLLAVKPPYDVLVKAWAKGEGGVGGGIERIIDLGKNLEFWGAVREAFEFLRRVGPKGFVTEGVFGLLGDKNSDELNAIEKNIKTKLEKGVKESIDVEYWEKLLTYVALFKAKEVMAKWHKKAEITQNTLFEKFDFDENLKKAIDKRLNFSVNFRNEKVSVGNFVKFKNEGERDFVFSLSQTETQFFNGLRLMRIRVLREQSLKLSKSVGERTLSNAQTMFERESAIPLEADEQAFASSPAPSSQPPGAPQTADSWVQEKFRPRKPLYFNRVKMGYDWSKYNRSHYDSENPPPKIVQGYRFNVFYPDLLDHKASPRFTLAPDAEDSDFAVLRFSAGAPYEDVAFRVVNKEWNKDVRGGYHSTFSGGVLKLVFNFRRYPYRR